MKKIEAIIRETKFPDLQEALGVKMVAPRRFTVRQHAELELLLVSPLDIHENLLI